MRNLKESPNLSKKYIDYTKPNFKKKVKKGASNRFGVGIYGNPGASIWFFNHSMGNCPNKKEDKLEVALPSDDIATEANGEISGEGTTTGTTEGGMGENKEFKNMRKLLKEELNIVDEQLLPMIISLIKEEWDGVDELSNNIRQIENLVRKSKDRKIVNEIVTIFTEILKDGYNHIQELTKLVNKYANNSPVSHSHPEEETEFDDEVSGYFEMEEEIPLEENIKNFTDLINIIKNAKNKSELDFYDNLTKVYRLQNLISDQEEEAIEQKIVDTSKYVTEDLDDEEETKYKPKYAIYINRQFVNEFSSYSKARDMLDKLQKQHPNAELEIIDKSDFEY